MTTNFETDAEREARHAELRAFLVTFKPKTLSEIRWEHEVKMELGILVARAPGKPAGPDFEGMIYARQEAMGIYD